MPRRQVFSVQVLDDLCAELPLLRRPLPAPSPSGRVARAMHAACMPFSDQFITPMAAVAGAVADAILAEMISGREISRAFVNNGGDIAFHLSAGASLRCGLIIDISSPVHASLDGTFLLTAGNPARGVATSGRACKGSGGRSFSLGIADSVSILARTAAEADAAATMVGNAVDLPGHAAIDRRPASEIDPGSDLGDRLVTNDIGCLTDEAVKGALDAGVFLADILVRNGLIEGAVLALGGHVRTRYRALVTRESLCFGS